MNIKRFLVALFIALFSILMAYGFSGPVITAVQQLSWKRTDCLVETAQIDSRLSDGINVRYSYEVDGTHYTGTTWALPSAIQTSKEKLTSEINRLESGTTVPCWYSPSALEKIVLVRESIWVSLFLILPLMGFLGAFLLMRASIGRERSGSGSTTRQKMNKNDTGTGGFFARVGIYLFFGIFILVGLILSYVFCLRHLYAVYEAKQWSETICTIKSSEVKTHTSTDSKTKRTSTSYSVQVSYHFLVGNKKYAGDTYSLGDPAQSDSEYANGAVNKIPPGSQTPCFYDPNDPTRSTISRELENVVWLGLMPLIFTFGGFLGFLYTLQSGPSKQAAGRGPAGRVKKAQSRILGVINLLLVNLVWNGIVVVGTYAFLAAGNAGWFLAVIILPFALIGIVLLLLIPYSVLQVFNPSVDIQTVDGVVKYGENLTVGWKLNGRSRRVSKLRITMELLALQPPRDDVSSEGVGNRHPNTTQRQEFERVLYTKEIFSTENQNRMEKGTTSVRVPEAAELSIPPGSRNLRWKVSVYLVIRWYPDAQDSVILDAQ